MTPQLPRLGWRRRLAMWWTERRAARLARLGDKRLAELLAQIAHERQVWSEEKRTLERQIVELEWSVKHHENAYLLMRECHEHDRSVVTYLTERLFRGGGGQQMG